MIYILRNAEFPIFLMAVYAKNEKSDLSKKEKNALHDRATKIFTQYGRVKP